MLAQTRVAQVANNFPTILLKYLSRLIAQRDLPEMFATFHVTQRIENLRKRKCSVVDQRFHTVMSNRSVHVSATINPNPAYRDAVA